MKKTPLSLLLALALAVCPIAAAGTPPDADQKYRADMDEGIALLRTGNLQDIQRAIAKFKAALKVQPESAEAYYMIALAHSDLGNYLRAADNAKDATIYDDKLAEAWLLWGQVLIYQKEWREARDKLETASRLSPEDPRILYNQGRVYYHGFKDPDSALPKFRAVWQKSQALRRQSPDNVPLILRARLYMGYCEFDRGRWDNAINAFTEVLAEQPDNYDAYMRLAISFRRANRTGDSVRMLQSMLEAIPPSTTALRQLLAEVNLQLADIYLKDPVYKNLIFAVAHLQEFVNQTGDLSHPALEPAREYLALYDMNGPAQN